MPDESKERSAAPGVPVVTDRWPALLQTLEDSWPSTRWRDVGVVVGCSGGADSVCLVSALAQGRQATPQPRGFIVVAHFNHGLRGEASVADQRFVEQLAEQHGFAFTSRSGDGSARDESSLRSERLQFLIESAHRAGARYIALAHSADDNVETVLHNLLRGTGPAGLAGIPPHRSVDEDLVLVRPLLRARRHDIRAALGEIRQTWREDASNLDRDYRRNWLRHDVLPLLGQQFPQAPEAILRAIDGQQQWLQYVRHAADQWLERQQVNSDSARSQHDPVHRRDNTVRLRHDSGVPEAVVVLALQTIWDLRRWPRQSMNQTHWKRVAAAVRGTEPERFTLPGQIDVSSVEGFLVIHRQT